MNVIEFLINNWDFILLIIVALVCIIWAIFKGNKSVVMSMLVSLVTEAEKNLGSGTGALKLATVIATVYPKLPAVIKTFISSETLTKWVEEALIIAKEKWRTNADIKAYIEPTVDLQEDITNNEKPTD